MLKPGGVFITSTVCLGGRMTWFRYVAPIGKALGLIPLVRFFTEEDLKQGLKRAGFHIEHDWRHAKGIAVFIVAKKIDA